MAGLAFAGVWKRYGDVEALRGLDLEVAEGELLVLVGPSGSGKSTALRVAAGLEDATDGSVRIGARDVTRIAPGDRNVSMVFQSYALFPHLDVRDNIGFGLRARRVRRREAESRIAEAARMVGCAELLDRKPYELSGGERQRVALARALVREPDVFLLDEPLSNLDAQLRVETRAELKRLHRRVGRTMVYVTHDQVEALTMGDRVAVLEGGVLRQVAPPDDVYRQPANRFVAHFIGSPAMNFMEARVDDGRLRAGPFDLDPPAVLHDKASSLELGIRPEHLAVSLDGEGVPAEVEVIELAGDETFLHLDASGHRLVARTNAALRPPVGAVVRVALPRDRIYFFDAKTGETITDRA